jgi:hypothetical protein
VEGVYGFIPDAPGQFGFSVLASAVYLKRDNGGLLLRLAPMGSKEIDGLNGLPNILYVALPVSVDARGGNYTTGTQLVFGSLFDLNDNGRYYAGLEGGISLAKSESYILGGLGMRIGELKFENKDPKKSGGKDDSDEYRDEDFKN